MTNLTFTLNPEACARIHDALLCMSKFSDTVALEARANRLSLSAVNLSKSGYTSFALDSSHFFEAYEFRALDPEERFTCEFSNKALQSVFKSRLLDARKGETGIDRCDVVLQDGQDQVACRFIFKMICDQGVVKTYRLSYEPAEVMHALFDKQSADNHWSMRSTFLRDYIEYFGQRTEQLDFHFESHQVTFTSFTEKIIGANKEVLRQPMQTAVTVASSDFEELSVQENLHIRINVKDFRSVITHAVTLNTQLNASFSRPGRPMQFHYKASGIEASFILMTAGDAKSVTSAPASGQARAVKPLPEPAKTGQAEVGQGLSASSRMPPPAGPSDRQRPSRAVPAGSALAPQDSLRPSFGADSLFVPEDEDQQWDPQNLDEEEDTLGWDATADNNDKNNNPQPTFKDTSSTAKPRSMDLEDGIQPTQRISQIKGLW